MIKLALFVGMGGFIGSSLRFIVSQLMIKWAPGFAPSGTLVVNVVGCFLLGLLIQYSLKMDRHLFVLITSGFCGGFTTFSTFSLENINLIVQDHWQTAVLYISASLILGLLAAYAGWSIGK